jgi:hypothetical protein
VIDAFLSQMLRIRDASTPVQAVDLELHLVSEKPLFLREFGLQVTRYRRMPAGIAFWLEWLVCRQSFERDGSYRVNTAPH